MACTDGYSVMKRRYIKTRCGSYDTMPVLRVSTKLNKYRVRFNTMYQVGDERGVFKITIPSGFAFDGASLPRAVWSIMGQPYAPKFIRASLLHDYLYKTGEASRKRADELFYEILRLDGVNWLKAQTMHKAVRSCGWMFYKEKKQ